jgi:hypothetical protein
MYNCNIYISLVVIITLKEETVSRVVLIIVVTGLGVIAAGLKSNNRDNSNAIRKSWLVILIVMCNRR